MVVVVVISRPPTRRPWPIHAETSISGTPAAGSRDEKGVAHVVQAERVGGLLLGRVQTLR